MVTAFHEGRCEKYVTSAQRKIWVCFAKNMAPAVLIASALPILPYTG